MTTDTQPMAPTDAELLAVWDRVSHIADAGQRRLACLRAVLAKWGQPVIATKISIPTNTMEQEFQKHYRRGYEAGKKAATPQPTQAQAGAVPVWIVNDLGELGVQVNGRCFFLYKGDNIEYGEDDQGEVALHDDGSPMHYRIVGKREFGETCWPLAWILRGRSEDRYTQELVFTPGLSFGNPEDGLWRELPTPHGIKGGQHGVDT